MPYEEDEEAIQDDPERVDDFNEALVNMVTYFELTYLGRPRTDGPRRKPRFPSPPGQSMCLSLWKQSSVPIVLSLGTQCLN